MSAAKRVLLVLEGDQAVRESLKFSLEIDEFDVRTYASPDELLNDDDLPTSGCLLVHYHLPETNGLDVIAELRKRGNVLPALLMTGRPDRNVRGRAAAAGITLVEKPFQGTELTDCIRKLQDG